MSLPDAFFLFSAIAIACAVCSRMRQRPRLTDFQNFGNLDDPLVLHGSRVKLSENKLGSSTSRNVCIWTSKKTKDVFQRTSHCVLDSELLRWPNLVVVDCTSVLPGFHVAGVELERSKSLMMVEEVSAMSARDGTRDEDFGLLAEQCSTEGGIQARSIWERHKQMSNKYREEGNVVMQLYHSKLLADGLTLAAQNIGQDVGKGVAGFMAGANVTWKEATYWVHRWVKLVLEQKSGDNPLVRRPEFCDMRRKLVVACCHQLRLSRFDEVIETANFFLQVLKPAEAVTEEQLDVQLMKATARHFLGSAAAVIDFYVAVQLAQQLNCKEVEAKAWYGMYRSLRLTDSLLYADDIHFCLERYKELVSQVPDGRVHVEALFGTHPMSCDHQQETETIQRLEKELLAKEQSSFHLAEHHFSLGRLQLKHKELVKGEENLKKAIQLWRSTPVIKGSGVVHQVTAQLQMAPTFQLLQLCLVEQGKLMEAMIWAERARAWMLRNALIHAAGHEDEFDEDDKQAEDKIMAALSSCTGSVVAVEYSFVGITLLIWVLKPGFPPTVHQVSLDEFDFLGQDGNQPLLKNLEVYLEKLLTLMNTSRVSDKTTKFYLTGFHKILIDPIKQELTGFDTIIFVPIHVLHRLPWTALIDEQQKDGEKYLIQRFAVVIAPSLFALGVYSAHLARNISRSNTVDVDEILVVANPWPLSLPKLPPLLGGEAEAAAIVKLVKAHTGLVTRVYKGEDANREAVIENLLKAKWVHMACHNIVNKKYNAGALMLAAPAMKSAIGNWMTQLKWSQEQQGTSTCQLPSGTTFVSSTNFGSLVGTPMDEVSSEDEMIRAVLSAQQLSNYKLQACGVVLSACSSSEGVLVGEEGILGLARALLVAGAPAVLLSLWNTQDVQTSELMTQVYKRLITRRHLETRLPYNLAFAHREAVLSIIGKKDIQVRDWAVFQIYGTPDVMFPVGNQFGSWLRRSNTATTNIVALGIAFCSILVAVLYKLSTIDVILGKG